MSEHWADYSIIHGDMVVFGFRDGMHFEERIHLPDAEKKLEPLNVRHATELRDALFDLAGV